MNRLNHLLEDGDIHSQFEAALCAPGGDQIPVEINSASIPYVLRAAIRFPSRSTRLRSRTTAETPCSFRSGT
jgi:hypothetical protein